jgi:hypothetical protein
MVSGADQQHRLIGGEMLLSRESDGVAMSALTATGMLLRIRRNAATASSLSKGACYLMSAVDAWFIGTEFAEATTPAQREPAPPPRVAPTAIGPTGDENGSP